MKQILYTTKKAIHINGQHFASGEIVSLDSMHMVVNGTSTVTIKDMRGYLHNITDNYFRRMFTLDTITGV